MEHRGMTEDLEVRAAFFTATGLKIDHLGMIAERGGRRVCTPFLDTTRNMCQERFIHFLCFISLEVVAIIVAYKAANRCVRNDLFVFFMFLFYYNMMFAACLALALPKPESSNRSSGLIRNSYLLDKQMIEIIAD
jgi:hypothetical protein